MIRLFNVYYPARTLMLVIGEAVVVCASFVAATMLQRGPDWYLVLDYENGFYKILGITGLALLCSYYFDLYDMRRLASRGETYFRLLVLLGTLSLMLAAVEYVYPAVRVAPGVFLVGLSLLTVLLTAWRALCDWMMRLPMLRERVYVLGAGERAQRVVNAIRARPELGLEVIGWAGAVANGSLDRDMLARLLESLRDTQSVDRVIVAIADRRGLLPVRELLDLRLNNVKVEEATDVLERIESKIEVDNLNPSWLVFGEGFRLNTAVILSRRIFSVFVALVLLLLALPLLPLIALAVKLSSPGPVLYKQARVGRHGKSFYCYKFRTMRADAEADTGPTWAGDEDPRITRVGRFLRSTRLDELPQLWNVFCGDMGFVGPRPERPEFTEMLSREIPYYPLRHIIRPGITGWAQVCYEYGASVEQAKEKLRYDLYYIKHISLSFDLYIIFTTIKIVLFGRGAR